MSHTQKKVKKKVKERGNCFVETLGHISQITNKVLFKSFLCSYQPYAPTTLQPHQPRILVTTGTYLFQINNKNVLKKDSWVFFNVFISICH